MHNKTKEKKGRSRALQFLPSYWRALSFVLVLLLSSQSIFAIQKQLVTNGNFSNGNSDFYSDYSYNYFNVNSNQNYSISSNPSYLNSSMESFWDHTSGNSSGQMLVANGATNNNAEVWYNDFYVTQGQTYTLSFWVRNAYYNNPSTLTWTVNGSQVGGSINANDSWQLLEVTYVATVTGFVTFGIIETSQVSSGNVFAIDDVSIIEDIPATCSGYFYDTGGPNGNYSDNESYYVTYCAPYGQNIRFNFTSFNTRNGSDFLRVFDGVDQTGNLIGTYDRSDDPGTITSDGACLTFYFQSNNSQNRSGWEATISCVNDSDCDEIDQILINQLSGSVGDIDITSGGTLYTNNFPSSWNLEAGVNGSNKNSSGKVSVLFEISGDDYYSNTENAEPFRSPNDNGSISWGPGTYNIDVTLYENDGLGGKVCDYKSTTLIIEDCNLTAFNPTSNSPVCTGNNITLDAGNVSGATYSWSGPNGFTSSQRNPTIANASTFHTGIYSVTVTMAGCSASATTAVNVNESPIVSVTKNNATCGQDNGSLTFAFNNVASQTNIQFSLNGGSSYPYSVPDNSGTTTITNLAPGTYNLMARWGNSSCPVSVGTQTISRVSGTAAISGNLSICSGQSTTLTATLNNAVGTVNYSWSNGLGTGNSKSVSPTSNTSYTVTGTDSQGCTGTASVQVVVNALPSATASSNSPVCAGGTLNLSANSGMSSYLWTAPNGNTYSTRNPSIASVNSSFGGTYTLRVTNSNGCQRTATTNVTITVGITPTVSNTGPYCEGQTISLTASGGSTYTWSGPGGFSSSGSSTTRSNASIPMSGTYQVTATQSGTGCSATATTNVSVLSSSIGASNTGPVCQNGNVSFAATGGNGTYSWSGPGSFTSTSSNPGISNVGIANEGIYTVTSNITPSCPVTATTELTVYALPNVTVTDTVKVCTGDNATLSASGGTSYRWVGPGGFDQTNTSGAVTINNVTNAKTGIYTVTLTNASGCTSTGTTSLVISFPSLVVSSNSPVCQGDNIVLTASGGINYSWLGPNGFSSGTSSNTITNATAAKGGNYVLTIENSLGCTATSNVPVNVLLTNPSITGTANVCVGDSIKLDLPHWESYSWTGPSGFTSSVSDPVIPSATMSNSGVYSVTVSKSGGCTATATFNVTMRALPNLSISGNTTVCKGAALTLNVSGANSYIWEGPNSFASTATSFSIPNMDTPKTGYYIVEGTNSFGCKNKDSVNVGVSVPAPVASGGGTVCLGASISLNASGGATYSWIGPASFTSTSQNPTRANAAGTMTGVYTVTVVNSNTCSATATVNVVVSIPQATITASNVCLNKDLVLSGSGGSSYAWTGPSGFSSSLQNPVITSAQLSNSGNYVLTVTDSASCVDTENINIVVNTLPTATASNSNPTCAGQTLQLSSTGGTSYSWSGVNGFGSNVQNPTIANTTAAQAGIYTVTAYNNNGCSATATTSVSILALPTPTATTANGNICQAQTIQLTGGGGGTYLWTTPDGQTSTSANYNRPNATATMSGIYTLTVTNANNCTATATVSVVVHPFPPPPTASNVTRCGAGAATLTASGCAGTISWYATNTSSTVLGTGSTYTTPYMNVGATEDYYATCTIYSCQSVTRTRVDVEVLQPPTNLSVSNTGIHCVYSAAKLFGSASNTASYSWAGPGGFTSNEQSPRFVTQLNSGGVYTMTATAANGCTATATTNLSVVNDCGNICTGQYIIIPSNPSSCSNSNGAVTISATSSYETSLDGVNWDRANASFTGLGVGNYFFYVRDYNTKKICKNVSNTLVSTTSTFYTGESVTAATGCYDSTGSIQLQGVRSTDQVTWLATLESPSVLVSSLNNSTIENLAPGKYYVKVSRANEYCYSDRYVDVPSNTGSCETNILCDDDSVPNLFPNGDFGSGADENGPALLETQYGYSNYTCYSPWDGFYSITNNTDCDGNGGRAFSNQVVGSWDVLNQDHTPGDTDGYMMVINAGYTPNIVIEKLISNLCPNTQYNFTAWMRNISPESTIQPNAAFIIDGVIRATSGEVRGDQWQQVGFSFKTGSNTTEALFALRNIAPGGFGNNWILDDIKVSKCPLEIELAGNTVACLGGASEQITASVNDPYEEHVFFKWEKSDDNGATWEEVAPVTQGTYVSGEMNVDLTLPTPIVSAITGRIYRVRLSTTEATIDDPSCSIYSALTEIIVPPIEMSLTPDTSKCIGSVSLELISVPSGGGAPYTFEWSTAETTSSIFVNPAVDTEYIVTARDSSNCPVTDTVLVQVKDQPTLEVTIDQDSVCVDGMADIVAHVEGGSGVFEFTWYTTTDTNGTWTTIPNQSDSVYMPPTTSAGRFYYRVYVDDLVFDCNDALSNSVLFEVVDDPVVDLNLNDLTLCIDGSVELNPIVSGGTGTMSYQWQSTTDPNSGWTDMASQTNQELAVPTDNEGIVFYRIQVSSDGNGCDFPPSDSARIEVLPVFTVDVSLDSNLVCEGGEVILLADTTSGTGTITYQWYSSSDEINFSTMSGSTDIQLSPNTSSEGTMYYQVLATATGIGCGTAASDTAVVQVLPEYTVDLSVDNALVCIDGAVEFTAETGSGIGSNTYRWFVSANATGPYSLISGSTGTSYSPITGTPGTRYYQVEATSSSAGCGMDTSEVVSLEVLPEFSVDVRLDNSSLCVGGTFTLTADTSNGTGDVTYHWYQSIDGAPFALLPGEEDSTLTVTPSSEGTYRYYVEATAEGPGCGSVVSDEAVINVLPSFTVDVSLDDNVVCIDGLVVIAADTNSGTGAVNYQWFSSSDGISFNPITDSTNRTLTPNTGLEGTNYYRVRATSSGVGCGMADSDTSRVQVLPVFDVDVSIDNAIVCIGGVVELKADTINGTGNITYEWFSSSNFAGPFTVIPGEVDTVYYPSTTSDGTTYYQVRATADGAGCGTVESDIAEVEVLPVFSVDISPSNSIICLGGTVRFSADTSNGTGDITYKWYQGTNAAGPFAEIPGEVDSVLNVTPSAEGMYYYYVEATASGSGCGTVASAISSIEVLPTFTVDVSLDDNVVCIDGLVVIAADTNSGTGAVNYQWFSSSDGISFNPITDSTNRTLTPNTGLEGTNYYRVRATSSGVGCGMADSDTSRVQVLPVFNVDVTIDNAIVCIGGVVELKADTINGTGNITYEWFSSSNFAGPFTVIPGEVDTVYYPSTTSDGTTYYQVRATADGAGCGTVESDIAEVEVLPVFSVDVSPESSIICLGGTVRISADTSNGTGAVSYQWFESTNIGGPFSPISGETDSILNVTPGNIGHYYYYVEATAQGSGCGTVSSGIATIEVLPNFDVEVVVEDYQICTNGLVILEADTISGSGTISYQWQYSSDGVSFSNLTDSTNIRLYPSTGDTGTFYYQVIATASGEGCGTATSDVATIDVQLQMSIDVDPGAADICVGDAVTFEGNPQNGVGNITYQWQEYNGSTWSDISGATDALFNPNTSTGGQYTYRITAMADGIGCTDAESAPAILTISDYPDVTVSQVDPLCVPDNGQITFTFSNEPNQTRIEFSIDGGVTYPYATYDSLGSFSIDTLTEDTYLLFARWEGGNCPVDLGAVTISDRPAPQVTVVYTDPTCTIDNGTITFTFPDESTRTQLEFSWDGGLTYQPAVNDNLGSRTYVNFSPGNYDLWVRWENDECPVDLGSISMVDHPSPQVTINQDTTICVGETVNLLANSTGGDGTIAFTWNNSLPNGATQVVSPLLTTTYIVTATDTNACFDRDTVTITVNPLPVVTVSGGEYCQGDSISMAATGGVDYEWSGPQSFTFNGENAYRLDAQTVYQGYYSVLVTDANGCENSDSTNIIVHAAPSQPIVSDEFLCGPGEVTFSASGCSGGDISWYTSTIASSAIGFGTTFVTDSISATRNYYVTCTDSNGCMSTERKRAVAEIRHISTAEVNAINSTCIGEVALNNGIILVNGFREGEMYSYSLGNTYNAGSATPSSPAVIPSNGKITENINNPVGVSESYTVRILSTDGCPIDHTVDFIRQCEECLPYCEPAQFIKVK